MEEEMVHGLPITFAHTTPINHNDNVRIFPSAANQAKKTTFKGTLACQILFQGKGASSLQAMTL
jgi:hypothetical protein